MNSHLMPEMFGLSVTNLRNSRAIAFNLYPDTKHFKHNLLRPELISASSSKQQNA